MPKPRRKQVPRAIKPGTTPIGWQGKGGKGGKKGEIFPRPRKGKGTLTGGPKAPNKGNQRRRRLTKLQKRAWRDVRLGFNPLLDAINREQRGVEQQGRDWMNRSGQVYGALLGAIQPLNAQYQQQAQQIGNQFVGQAGQFADMYGQAGQGLMGTGAAVGELAQGENPFAGALQAATQGAVGNIGQSALEDLATSRQGFANWHQGTVDQAAVERMVLQRDILKNVKDRLQEFSQQRVDVRRDIPATLRQRIDELRQQQFERGIALKELALRDRLARAEQALANRQFGLAARGQSFQEKLANRQIAQDELLGDTLGDVIAADAEPQDTKAKRKRTAALKKDANERKRWLDRWYRGEIPRSAENKARKREYTRFLKKHKFKYDPPPLKQLPVYPAPPPKGGKPLP